MIRSLGLLLSVAFTVTGCKTVPQPAQTDSRSSRSVDDDKYNRDNQTESRHRHSLGKRGEANNDGQSYDRAGTAKEPADSSDSGAQVRSQNDSRGSGRHHNRRALTAAPGQFDFYVLNLSWSPEFCRVHASAAECAQHRAFTLHGLWPQNSDGTYPEDCSEIPGPSSPSAVRRHLS